MNKEQFFEEVLEAVKNQIPQVVRDEIEVSVHEVIKTNDEVLHGISVMLPETNCAPTIYMEDCYKDYLFYIKRIGHYLYKRTGTRY